MPHKQTNCLLIIKDVLFSRDPNAGHRAVISQVNSPYPRLSGALPPPRPSLFTDGGGLRAEQEIRAGKRMAGGKGVRGGSLSLSESER